jgi:hypothetical protein
VIRPYLSRVDVYPAPLIPQLCCSSVVLITKVDTRGIRPYCAGDNTQALIYFAVAKLGEKPTDGITDNNPEVRCVSRPLYTQYLFGLF